jgi:hypothetical protein
MEYFESIIKTLLEHEGYWVRLSFKVNLTKQEKKQIGKASIPRPEIDILAFKPKAQEVLALEAKSYFDSPGVRLADLQEECRIPEGRYKLFTCTNYRDIVFNRLRQDLRELGMVGGDLKITLGLVAGNIYQGLSAEIRAYVESKGWFFWSPEDVRDRVNALAAKGYENDPAIITAKILMRSSHNKSLKRDAVKSRRAP